MNPKPRRRTRFNPTKAVIWVILLGFVLSIIGAGLAIAVR